MPPRRIVPTFVGPPGSAASSTAFDTGAQNITLQAPSASDLMPGELHFINAVSSLEERARNGTLLGDGEDDDEIDFNQPESVGSGRGAAAKVIIAKPSSHKKKKQSESLRKSAKRKSAKRKSAKRKSAKKKSAKKRKDSATFRVKVSATRKKRCPKGSKRSSDRKSCKFPSSEFYLRDRSGKRCRNGSRKYSQQRRFSRVCKYNQ